MRRFLLIAAAIAAAAGSAAPAASAGVLNVTLAGNGAGAVASSPAGIDCSNVPGSTQTACSHDFGFVFSTGTLTATPDEGSAFVAWSGTAGGTCTGATNPCTTGLLFLDMAATATFAPKPDPPALTTGAPTGVAFPSATVNGTVNPGSNDFAVSECYFEYGPTTDYGEKSLCRPGSIGSGTSPVAVSASIGVLDPGKTYHYRLVAANGGGKAHSEDQTLTAGVAPADSCSNAKIRAQQGALAQRLPNCGAYELVSPLFSAGQAVNVQAVGTADGNRLMLASVGGFAETENLPDLGVQYAARRTASGWETSAIAPPASEFPYIGQYAALDWARDGSRSLWFANLKPDEGTNRFTPIVRDTDGSFYVAGPTQSDANFPGATSEDLGTVVQRTTTRPALTDGTVDARSTSVRSLYASVRTPDGQLETRQIAYRLGATMFPSCSAEVGGVSEAAGESLYARNAVSRDGRKIFFTSAGQGVCGAPSARRVWARVDDDDPIDLSASQCVATCGAEARANYRGASRDGSRVYFTTEQRLVLEDQDTSAKNDLYEYDFNSPGQELRLVTGSTNPAGAGVATAGLFRMSDDGAYVYFVATGRPLAGTNARGDAPQSGHNNLYVYHRAAGQASGTTKFVGDLGSTYGLSPHVSETGRYLLFQTTADLTGERVAGDTHPDLYRYDSQADELLRVWTDDPAHNGAARADGAVLWDLVEGVDGIPSAGSQVGSGWNRNLQVSADGSLVGFTTTEPLSRDDRNAATDGYLWEAATGRLTMLTDGTSRPGNRYAGSEFSGMNPSGDSLFVKSASPLVKEHNSGQNAVYVIRRDGGFPDAPAPDPPCVGDGCQPPTSPPPSPGGSAGSSIFTGPGNLLTTPVASATVRVGKVGSVRGTSTRLSVKVSGKGKIQVSGANLARTSAAAGNAGSFKVAARLSKAGKRTLRQKGRVKVRATVRFAPASGKPVKARVSLTFTVNAKKKSKAKASPRAARELSVLSSDVQKGR